MKKQTGALVRALMCHVAVILSLMYLVLFFIDRVNTAMEFINNDVTKILLAVLAAVSAANAVITWGAQRRQALLARKKQAKKQAEKRGRAR